MPANPDYTRAHRAIGAEAAANELFTRLWQAGLAPEYLEVVSAFAEECQQERQAANEPMLQHLEGLSAVLFEDAYEAQRHSLSHVGRPAA